MNIDKLKEYFEYRNDGVLVWKKSKSKAKIGQCFGSNQGTGYIQGQFDGKHIYAHRLIWAFHYGDFPDGEIDHINGNSRDNRIENLRVVSRYENSINTHKCRSDSKSGVKGVQQAGKMWKAKITVMGKRIHLGHFESIDDAANAYMSAKRSYHYSYSGAKL